MFRSAYAPRLPEDDFRLHFVDADGEPLPGCECITEQHHKDMCCINNVLKQYDRTGLITHVNQAKAQYGDFTTVNEYQESLNLVIAAQDNFMALPSDIRKRFGNDPGAFLEFATDPANLEAMVELGLAEKPFVEPPVGSVILPEGDPAPAV